ncbi:tetratricopeptide repeat protein [Octadecabacter ascidiaceicola]|uniref:Tetratricopeptide repeat protein n=1 Tax=Octadecabacter ascidiaceicola TaxID=1655543 RepID=A0A238K2Z4_9RHOB|nr:tetratricopeptide repeat protein [Octadecabacter ascidiaceicola]SMX37235.1 Tetratricopeptide repeat protein [Octadecabacter ascidiaceicola]
MKHAIAFSLIAVPFLAGPAVADCAVGRDYSDELAVIVDQMQFAPDQGRAQDLASEMWEIWLDAPDALAQGMLDEGLAHQRYGDYAASRAVLTELIEYCPDYAEGYNQRAYAAFLAFDFEAALTDLDVAIALQPLHLGALTGKARTLIEVGRDAEAQEVLRTALAINPWLAERALLTEELETDL